MDANYILIGAAVCFVISLAAFLWATHGWYQHRFYCGLTCDGGSEKRRCPCVSPLDCQVPRTRDRHIAAMIRDRARKRANPDS